MSDQSFPGNGKILHKIRHHEEDIHDVTWAPPPGAARVFRDEEGAADGNPDDDDEGDDALFAASGRDRQGRFSVLSRVAIQ